MHLSKCKFCGTVFKTKKKEFICENCKSIDDAVFTKIELYLQKFPNSNAIQIAEGAGVSVIDVLQYIDEGRLRLSKGEFKKLW